MIPLFCIWSNAWPENSRPLIEVASFLTFWYGAFLSSKPLLPLKPVAARSAPFVALTYGIEPKKILQGL